MKGVGIGGYIPSGSKYADRANNVPMDGGASSSAAFGSFIRELIMMAAGGAAGAAAGGAAGAAGGAGAGGGNALGAGLMAGEAAAAPSLAAAGASPAMWGEAATGSMGGSFGPMVGLGRSSVMPGVLDGAASASPGAVTGLAQQFARGFSRDGLGGGVRDALAQYGSQQPAGSALSNFAAGVSRSGNTLGGLQAQFMDPSGAAMVGDLNMFDLTNMGVRRALEAQGPRGKRRGWWE